MNKEELFHNDMLSIYRSVGKATGYWANYFLRAVRKKGGLTYAKQALSKKEDVQDGFFKLIEVGKPELSMEALVVLDEFQDLFTQSEINEARRRLALVPEYAWSKKVDPKLNFMGEITLKNRYSEGSVMQVVVNVYERDGHSRQICLEKHGYNCKVCSFNFVKIYGEIGRGFIHVHHIKPLAAIHAGYILDPIRDLVPVCPNCHAMLHSNEPPLTVEELKERIKLKVKS